ncbi:hypothetical protein SADUNF_Sadunf15G0045500 [Salix dunnii]|uniref:Uncharacterized protein n=1 Tax=Salix dunnii TaxID=1413687 RepID=A0A835JDG9_9ROSI|nr:hypothetical protein SADUNF_Sadunf15G0045500 [Salix dunnii]
MPSFKITSRSLTMLRSCFMNQNPRVRFLMDGKKPQPKCDQRTAIYWRSCGVDRWRGAIRGVPRGGIECLPHIWERGECRQQLYPKEGTQLYDPKAGGWRDLGRLDVMQGRLGGNVSNFFLAYYHGLVF